MTTRRRAWLLGLVLGVSVLAVFGRIVGHEFFDYDLRQYLTHNPWVRLGLSWHALERACFGFDASIWHPVTWISFLLEIELFGLRPGPMHATNVALHVGNAVLVFVVLREMTGMDGRSLLVAALFAFHPQRVEAVAWVVERKELLAAGFGLLSLLFWIRWTRTGGRGAYALALACFAAGVMSKAMLVTWPCVMLLLDVWPLDRKSIGFRRRVVEKLPFFALSVFTCVLTYLAQRAGGAVQDLERFPLAARLANVPLAYAGYLGKTFWPTHLSIHYTHAAGDASAGTVGAAILAIAAVTATAVALRARAPWLLVGWLWFLGMFVPVIGIVQVGGQAMADRFPYLPVIGLWIAVVWSLAALLPDRSAFRIPAIAAAAVGCVTLAGLTWREVGFWKDTATLCAHTLAGDPGNLVARHLLGAWLVNHGRAQEAIPHLEATFERTPGDIDVQTNLAIAYGIVGRTDEAERMLRDIASRPPASATVRTELGRVLLRQGRAAEALAEIEAALRDRPEDVRALLALAIAHAQLDRPEARRTAIERLLALTPATAGDLDSLGSVLHREGLLSDAESVFQSAASLAPDRADIRRNVALATWAQRKREAALLEIEAAIRLAPRYALAHFTRGQILEELGRIDEARDELAAAADLDPARVEPRLTLARLLTRAEDLDGAERELRRAVTEAPANAEARRGLALVLIGQRRLDEALTEARAALALRPDWALATGDLAWILARRDDPSPGDRAEAVTLAEAAVQTTGRRHAGTLDALAAAYAGAGDFQRAAATAEEALQLALAQRDDPFATRVARRLLAYRAGEIDRDTPR